MILQSIYSFYTEKGLTVEADSCIKDGRGLISRLPGKIKYFYGYENIILMSGSVASKLKAENFSGLEILPVELVKSIEFKSYSDEIGDWIDYKTVKVVDDIFALYSSVILPEDRYDTKEMYSYYDIEDLNPLKPFDIAIKKGITLPHAPSIVSQCFYQFCKNNLGDLEWNRPIIIR